MLLCCVIGGRCVIVDNIVIGNVSWHDIVLAVHDPIVAIDCVGSIAAHIIIAVVNAVVRELRLRWHKGRRWHARIDALIPIYISRKFRILSRIHHVHDGIVASGRCTLLLLLLL